MSEYEFIWLQPWCEGCELHSGNEGRNWCQDDVWEQCDECGNKSVRYKITYRRYPKATQITSHGSGLESQPIEKEQGEVAERLKAEVLKAVVFWCDDCERYVNTLMFSTDCPHNPFAQPAPLTPEMRSRVDTHLGTGVVKRPRLF